MDQFQKLLLCSVNHLSHHLRQMMYDPAVLRQAIVYSFISPGYFLVGHLKSVQVIILFFLLQISNVVAQHENKNAQLPKIEQWSRFELEIVNTRTYQDSYRDVELQCWLTSPEGRDIAFWGFYDGDQTWKVRFSPDEPGKWMYKVAFTDAPDEVIEGAFRCILSDLPGQINQDAFNPFWMGYRGGRRGLFRSMHVGDRFFATNWDDPHDDSDGEARIAFLDWFQGQGYNMLSVASHYLNRHQQGRGLGWDTPKLWPLNAEEYRTMETILDTLNRRKIVVFPFAGFFGAKGTWPKDHEDQKLYIKYTLARTGFYWNTILNVAGPEPFWRQGKDQYQGAMKWSDINRLGRLIKSLDVHNHLLTVHNEKPATVNGDPFIDEEWYTMGTLQGPTTLDRSKLYSGLAMNHHSRKPLYAQETLWFGNKNHPTYAIDDLRKHAYTILFSGSLLNFADMDGNSSSGFSGTLDFEQLHLEAHNVVHQVWDFMESIPFYRLRKRQDLIRQDGYCLAKEGERYYIYLDQAGETELFLDYDYEFRSEWINASNITEIIPGPTIREKTKFSTPGHGDDWILHVYADRPKLVATGNFPDLAVDRRGGVHVVYNRDGLKYKRYDSATGQWTAEATPGCNCTNVKRSDPDIVVDRQGNPIVFCGTQAARFDGTDWIVTDPGATRDAELIIDSKDNVFICHRGGANGGHIGYKKLPAGSNEWIVMTDPYQKHRGPNDHVYSDQWITDDDVIHLVQRHGPVVEVTYRCSYDGGETWPVEVDVSQERSEAPHIVVDHQGTILISTGKGYVFEQEGATWQLLGRMVNVQGRHQPEFGLDDQNNVYLTAFGGRYNIKTYGEWLGEYEILPMSEGEIGFVETAGADNFAYVIWEEGHGNADHGLTEEAQIFLGRLYPDGRIIGLEDFN